MIYDKASVEVSYSPIKGPASKWNKIFNYWIKADSIAQQNNDINTLLIFQEVDDRMTEMYIKETCEAAIIVTFHPATAICINVQELEDSGGVWSLHS